MEIISKKEGFALLISLIFMSVTLALGLALASLSYKQSILASAAVQSQYAFYAADTGLECGLYADQQKGLLNYSNYPTLYNPDDPAFNMSMSCDGFSRLPDGAICYNDATNCPGQLKTKTTFPINDPGGSGTSGQCAEITIYKLAPLPATPTLPGPTYIFSQGYNVSCAALASKSNPRMVARGLKATY